MKLEKRQDNRVLLSVPLRYKKFDLSDLEKDIHNKVMDLRGDLQDLSLGGVQVVSNRSFDPGDILELEVDLPGKGMVRTVAKVIWSKPATGEDASEFATGIHFIPVYEQDLEKLGNFLREGK